MSFDILGLGEILIDFTPYGKSESGNLLYERNPGGGVPNLVVAAAQLGAECAFIGKVGNDSFGRFLLKTLKDKKVCTDGLVLSDDYYTTAAFVQLEEDGERSFVFYREGAADTMLGMNELDLNLIDQTKIFHFSSPALTGGDSRETNWAAVRYAKEKNKIVVFDPNWREMMWPDQASGLEQIKKAIAYADIMKISEEELALITGYDVPEWEKGAEALIEMGPQLIILTLGNEGSSFYMKNGKGHVDAYKVTAVDTTGAGDACFGSFLAQFAAANKPIAQLSESELEAMLKFANAAAALCVTKRGGIPGMPTKNEINAFIASARN